MRTDTFPADGGFPGSDPELAFKQLILGAGSDIGVLEPGGRNHFIPEVTQGLKIAINHWLASHWLDSTNNWHQRWRGSICVAVEDPHGAAREIEYWAGHEYMSQVLINAEPGRPGVTPGTTRSGGLPSGTTSRSAVTSAAATTKSCPRRRSGCPATTTTSWSPTRCWPRTR